MSFIGALGNNTDDNNYNFNFNDLKIRIVDIDTSNYARFLGFNSSNYTDEIGLNSSNYTNEIGIHSSNYTDVIGFNSSNYTDVIDNYSSNYTERINQELSDRIGYPAPLFPVEIPTGVYFPLKQQELIIADVGRIVGLHTTAITGIEQQIIGLVGVEGGAVGIVAGAVTLAGEAYSKAGQALTAANQAKSTAETATITAEEGQTIAERAEGKADTALSIWNKGTGANINNVYHLQSGNVGIGAINDTELTHKLVVNGNSKLNGNVLLNGILDIEKINASSICNFAIYNNDTTIKSQCSLFLSNFTDVFGIDRNVEPTRTTPAIEIRCNGDPIIQVYRDKVDITKNFNVVGDINFTGNLYQNNSLFTSGGAGTGGTGGTTYDDTNRLNYEFLKEPIEDVITNSNIDEPTIIQDANINEPQITQTANIQEPTTYLFITEPTSSPSIAKTTIDSDYKYMSFVINTTPNLVYDFIDKNTLADWKTYANTIPNATYSLTDYGGNDGLWRTSEQVGFFEIILPSTHTRLAITWGNAYNRPAGAPVATTSLSINGVVVDSITDIIQTKVYTYNYTGTPTVRVSEGFSIMTANMIINLTNPTPNTYSINFPEQTQCDILVVGGGGAGGNSMGGGGGAGGVVYTVSQIMNGTYSIGVGNGGLGLSLTDTTGQGTVGIAQDGSDSFIRNAGNTADISLNMGGTSQNLRGIGGGAGAVYYSPSFINGRNGGSGGGCSEYNPNFGVNVAGTSTQPNTFWNGTSYIKGGSAGNINTNTANDYQGAGGGGAGGLQTNTNYTNGKTGVSVNITGTSLNYAGGGGAGQFNGASTSKGLGGSSVGGVGRVWNGSSYLREATSGANGTGSGGGGGAFVDNPDNVAGSGGSGIVIIRYKYTKAGTLQPITINSDYKYFSFPRTALNETLYGMNFLENTEVQLAILSNTYSKYVSPFIQTSGKINIIVGNSGNNSSFGSISTLGQTIPYNTANSDITGTNTSYTQAIVIVRYKYTRPLIQAQLIDSNYKYISFLNNTGLSQISYTINLQESTEIQLLLLDDLKYIEYAPYTSQGSTTINVGNPSTYNTITTNTNSTFYNFSTGHLSTITGTSTGYNKPIVIVRYKYTRTQVQIQNIDDNYKYVSFPYISGYQTVYGMNFPEETEVQLLLLNMNTYKEITPFAITIGSAEIKVGLNGPTTFKLLSTADTPTTSYTNHVSTITGSSITYNNSIVIVRYKYKKTTIIQVPKYGFLKYNNNNVWEVSDIGSIINNLITRIQTLESA